MSLPLPHWIITKIGLLSLSLTNVENFNPHKRLLLSNLLYTSMNINSESLFHRSQLNRPTPTLHFGFTAENGITTFFQFPGNYIAVAKKLPSGIKRCSLSTGLDPSIASVVFRPCHWKCVIRGWKLGKYVTDSISINRPLLTSMCVETEEISSSSSSIQQIWQWISILLLQNRTQKVVKILHDRTWTSVVDDNE